LNRQAAEEAGRLDAAFGGAVRLHDDAEYDVWLSGIGELTARFAAYSVQFDPAALMTGRDFQQRRDRLDRMNDAFRDQAAALHGAYGAWLTQLRAVEADLARRRDEERDQAEHSIAQALNLAAACPDGGESAYAALAERYGRYLAGTPEGAAGGDSGEENGGEPIRNRKVDAVAGDAFTLAERLQTALLTVRDRAYVIEYALTKFNYRTMGDAGGELSDPAGHVLPRQEAEYILYGWNSCAMNHGSAFAEMFLLRLAIRTAERLLAPDQAIASLGSPWLVFLRAVAEGAALALRDMRRLASGERVEISARLPQALTMDYKDYLRLFMVLHGDQTRMLARMQALVDLNTGVDLAERAALSEAEVEVLFRPWMLPAVPGRLGADARNGRLVIRVRAAQAY
jgi:hypothetical protein